MKKMPKMFFVWALTLVFLNACGGGGNSSLTSDTNRSPLALAGADQVVPTGTLVNLSGEGLDEDGDELTCYWSLVVKPAGSNAIIEGCGSLNAEIIPDVDGTYLVALTMNDGKETSTPAMMTITASSGNIAPVADAGVSQNVRAGTQVVLDGSGSSDPNMDLLQYSWTMASGPVIADLSDPASVRPSFIAPQPGTYVFNLCVDDGEYVSTRDSVEIIVSTNDGVPVALTTGNQAALTGENLQLDASTSYDPDDDTLTYRWQILSRPAGSVATLTGEDQARAGLITDIEGEYLVCVEVCDGYNTSVANTFTVTSTAENTPPTANAGTDQFIKTGKLVTLDGEGCSDLNDDDMYYVWQLLSRPVGSSAVLDGHTTAHPTFTADMEGEYVVRLWASDGKINSQPDSIIVTASDLGSPPVAHAGADQVIAPTMSAFLDGSSSTDADDDVLSYQWSFVSIPTGSSVNLVDATTSTPRFMTDVAGTYVVKLVVNDGTTSSSSDIVVIEANNEGLKNVHHYNASSIYGYGCLDCHSIEINSVGNDNFLMPVCTTCH